MKLSFMFMSFLILLVWVSNWYNQTQKDIDIIFLATEKLDQLVNLWRYTDTEIKDVLQIVKNENSSERVYFIIDIITNYYVNKSNTNIQKVNEELRFKYNRKINRFTRTTPLALEESCKLYEEKWLEFDCSFQEKECVELWWKRSCTWKCNPFEIWRECTQKICLIGCEF